MLVEGSLNSSSVDLLLPSDLLHQIQLEHRSVSLTLKEVHFIPSTPIQPSLQICSRFNMNIFMVLNFEEISNPRLFVKKLNTEFNKIAPNHTLATIKNKTIHLNLMPGQQVFTPHGEVFAWLFPDDLDTTLNNNNVIFFISVYI